MAFPTSFIDNIHNIRFVAEASLVVHSMKQRGAYGAVEIFEDFISYQQVLKFHTMLKLHGEEFPIFVPIVCHSNQ